MRLFLILTLIFLLFVIVDLTHTHEKVCILNQIHLMKIILRNDNTCFIERMHANEHRKNKDIYFGIAQHKAHNRKFNKAIVERQRKKEEMLFLCDTRPSMVCIIGLFILFVSLKHLQSSWR